MTKMSEIVAVVKSRKQEGKRALETLLHTFKKRATFEGRRRVYTPTIDGGQELPREDEPLAATVHDLVRGDGVVIEAIARMLDVTLQQDSSNCTLLGDVSVDGTSLLYDVPATHLIYLEKVLTDLETVFNHLPVLDDAVDWEVDNEGRTHSSAPIKKMRTAKVPKPIVKYDATPEHPAQTELIHEDVVVGFWEEVRISGAVGSEVRNGILDRIRKLRDAVRQARERVNSKDIVLRDKLGASLMSWILKGEG